jgi:hypothetical protein
MLPLPPATLPTMFMALSKVGEYLMTLRVSRDLIKKVVHSLVLKNTDDSVIRTVSCMRQRRTSIRLFSLTLLQHEVGDQVKEDLLQVPDTLHGAPYLLGTSLQHGDTGGKLLTRSVLLSKEEGNGDEDSTGGKETHQDSVRLEELSFGPVADGDSDTEGDGRTDDLKGRTGNVEQIVELNVSDGLA